MVLEALRLWSAFLEEHRETGVELDADNVAAAISLLAYFATEHRHLQARVLGTENLMPITDGTNIVSIKTYLEKAHVRTQA